MFRFFSDASKTWVNCLLYLYPRASIIYRSSNLGALQIAGVGTAPEELRVCHPSSGSPRTRQFDSHQNICVPSSRRQSNEN